VDNWTLTIYIINRIVIQGISPRAQGHIYLYLKIVNGTSYHAGSVLNPHYSPPRDL